MRRSGILAGLVLALVAVGQFDNTPNPTPAAAEDWTLDTISDRPACEPLILDEHIDDTLVITLQEQGWWADPEDNQEALYSPACPKPTEDDTHGPVVEPPAGGDHGLGPATIDGAPGQLITPIPDTTHTDVERTDPESHGCADGLIPVEDGTCVPPSFFEEPAPVADVDVLAAPAARITC